MLLSGGVRALVPVAHPVAGHPHLDVPVALLAGAAFLAVVVVGLSLPARGHADARPGSQVPASWEGELGPARAVVRGLVVVLVLLAVVAARTGTDNELENLAPALLVGAGWPLLFLGTLLVRRLWRWVDPLDTLARVAAPGDGSSPAQDVRPAAAVALALLWFLAVHSRPLDPRALGVAVAAYLVLTVSGCLVRGRRRWLSSAEPVGITLNWLARARPGDRGDGSPRGLHALLGILAGGTLFAALRRTELWTDAFDSTGTSLTAGTAGFVAACAAGAALVELQARLTGMLAGARGATPARRAVALAVVPAVAGTVVAVSMARNRLTNSVQLLPGLLGDPLGRGWDLLGEPTARPLGAASLLTAQLLVLVLAHLWGAVLAARLLGRQERLPAVLLLGQLVAAGIAAVSLH